MSSQRAQTIVIGAGIVGLATAAALKRRGEEVICLEAAEAAGTGSSNGECRLFRHRHSDPRLVDLAVTSLERWREWEQESGTVLVGDEGHIFATPGVEAEVHELRELGVDAHLLTAPEAQDHFLLLDGPEMAMGFDADAGVIRADRAIQVFRDFIGGDLVTERRVERISRLPDGGFAIQVSEEEAWLCERVVICAGAESPRLAREVRLKLPEPTTSWHLRPLFALEKDPGRTLSALSDRRNSYGAYVVPVPGRQEVAVGLARPHGSFPELPEGEVLEQGLADLARYVIETLPGVSPTPSSWEPCFSIALDDTDQGSDGIRIAAGGGAAAIVGGNMFKFAPELGRLLAVSVCEEAKIPDVLAEE